VLAGAASALSSTLSPATTLPPLLLLLPSLLLLLLLLLLQGRKYRYSGKHWLGPVLAFVAKALVSEFCMNIVALCVLMAQLLVFCVHLAPCCTLWPRCWWVLPAALLHTKH
jgi:hypothetical protein